MFLLLKIYKLINVSNQGIKISFQLKNSAEILRVKQYGKLYRAIDANVNDQVQICETKPPGIIDISENMSFRMEQKEPGDNQV